MNTYDNLEELVGEDRIYIDCIGVDNKIHVCEPSKNETYCGVVIKRKTLYPTDNYRDGVFHCGDCD